MQEVVDPLVGGVAASCCSVAAYPGILQASLTITRPAEVQVTHETCNGKHVMQAESDRVTCLSVPGGRLCI